MRKGIGDDAGNRRGTGVKKRRADAALYDDLNLESLQLDVYKRQEEAPAAEGPEAGAPAENEEIR